MFLAYNKHPVLAIAIVNISRELEHNEIEIKSSFEIPSWLVGERSSFGAQLCDFVANNKSQLKIQIKIHLTLHVGTAANCFSLSNSDRPSNWEIWELYGQIAQKHDNFFVQILINSCFDWNSLGFDFSWLAAHSSIGVNYWDQAEHSTSPRSCKLIEAYGIHFQLLLLCVALILHAVETHTFGRWSFNNTPSEHTLICILIFNFTRKKRIRWKC